MNWKVGDKAILVDDGHIHLPENRAIIGEECTIIRKALDEFYDWTVDVSGKGFEVKARCLRPIPDNDSKQVTTWDKCEFQPKELVTV